MELGFVKVEDTTVFDCGSCPCCGAELGATSNIDDKTLPVAGVCSICFQCGEILIFGDDMKLRFMTAAEIATWEKFEVWRTFKRLQREFRVAGPRVFLSGRETPVQ